jgi:drug/metabolite transporter (DMT)-like permease
LSWVIIALAASAVMAGINIVDKTMLQHYVRTHFTLFLLIGLFQTIIGLILVTIFIWSSPIAIRPVIWAFFSGSLFGLGGICLISVLRSQEVSRTVPIAQSAPIFAAILGYLFLGENLNSIQWLAVLVTASGALLLSVRKGSGYAGIFLHSSVVILLVSSFLTASGQVTGKVPLETLSVPLTQGFRALGVSSVLLLASMFRKDARLDVIFLVSSRSKGLLVLAFSEIVLVTTGFMLFLWAISLGPVGLVTAIGATRSIFVLIYSTAITIGAKDFLGENITPKTIAVKLTSVALIVSGVAAIAIY